MSLTDFYRRRSSRSAGTADPARAFGAGEPANTASPAAPRVSVMERGRSFGQRAGAFLTDLRTRISGGEDPSFDDPDWVPPPETVPEQNPYAGYAPAYEEPPYGEPVYEEQPAYARDPYPAEPAPSYDYSYYAQPQASAYEPAAEGYASPPPAYDSAAYAESAYDPYADPGFYQGYGAPEPAASREAFGGEWYGPENMPRPVARPRTKRKPGDLQYYFWSFGIVVGMLLTVVAFIYGCIV